MCPKGEFEEWHSRDCLYGECENCGVDYLPVCPVEEDGSSSLMVNWKRYEMKEIITKKGLQRKKLCLTYKTTSSAEFLDYLKPKLQFFIQHNFVARWEDAQFKKSLENIPADGIVSVIDFAENYSFEVQNKVQSMHWHSYQVSILVQISWIRNPNANPADPSSMTLMKYNFYISDDKSHDSYYVQHCLNLHWKSLHDSGFYPKQHWIWSDGCSNQFKSKVPWYYVSRYPALTGGCVCMWSFFGSGHGKGPHDGAGAVVKRYIRTAQLDAMGPELVNAEQVVNLLREKLSSRPETSYTSTNKSDVFRYFWHVTKAALETERKTPYMCMQIAGTRDLHQIRSVGAMETNRLLTRSLACFCFSCLECKWDECENLEWTRGWKVETLILENQAHVREAIAQTYDGKHWTDFGADGEHLASSLELGQNFATNAAEDNEAGVDFEVLMCTKVAYIVKKGFACDRNLRLVISVSVGCTISNTVLMNAIMYSFEIPKLPTYMLGKFEQLNFRWNHKITGCQETMWSTDLEVMLKLESVVHWLHSIELFNSTILGGLSKFSFFWGGGISHGDAVGDGCRLFHNSSVLRVGFLFGGVGFVERG